MKTTTPLFKSLLSVVAAVSLLSVSSVALANEKPNKDKPSDSTITPTYICPYFPWCKIEPRSQVPTPPPPPQKVTPKQ